MRRGMIKTTEVVDAKKKYRHRDCIYATDFHSLNYKGEPILCKCKFMEASILLNDPACVRDFKLK